MYTLELQLLVYVYMLELQLRAASMCQNINISLLSACKSQWSLRAATGLAGADIRIPRF